MPSSRTASTGSPASSRRAAGSSIDNVRFHDVRDADVIRGAADDVMISDSDLHDALAGTHGDNHNDLIQILGGGPWTIERSHFGVRSNGAAQVYVDPRSGPAGAVHDVHVDSSLFTGSNKDMFFAINVRDPAAVVGSAGDRRRVRQQHDRLGQHRGDRPRRRVRGGRADQRPLIQNNILGRQKHSLCDVARMVTNVIGSGATCPGDRRG